MKKILSIVLMASVAHMYAADATVTSIADSEVLGIRKIARSTTDIAVSVPFVQDAITNLTIDSMFVSGVGDDDAIQVWAPTNDVVTGSYLLWTYADPIWGWSSTTIDPVGASEYSVAPGQSFWFRNGGESSSMVMAGLVPSTISTTAYPGTSTAPKYTLMMQPYGEAVENIFSMVSNAGNSDQILIIGDTKRYEYQGSWGEWQTTTTSTGRTKKKFVTLNSLSIAAGKAFWYISMGGSPNATVTWY